MTAIEGAAFVCWLALLAMSPMIHMANASSVDQNIDWYKVLNNLISKAQHNTQISGEFLTNYPFANRDRVQQTPNCDRAADLDLLANPEKFDGVMKRIYTSGVLKVGVTSLVNNTPFFLQTPDGVSSGFFYDLGNIVANEIGMFLKKTIQAKFVLIPTTNFFVDITTALSKDTVDTVIGVSYLSTRILATDFSCWYEGPSPYAVWRDESKILPIATPTALSGWNTAAIKVATLPGTVLTNAINRFLPLATKVSFSNLADAANAVGKTVDILFNIIGETEPFANRADGSKLTIQPNTRTVFGGGNAFATRRV